jgi:hypothetical protein
MKKHARELKKRNFLRKPEHASAQAHSRHIHLWSVFHRLPEQLDLDA